MATFGVIITNRSFFPDHLVLEAREILLKQLAAWGHTVITLTPDDTFMGQTMSYEEAKKCAALLRAHALEMDGIIVSLPNFGEETGVADAIRMSGCDLPILVQACPDDLNKLQLEKPQRRFLRQAIPLQQPVPVRHSLHADILARVCAGQRRIQSRC